ncbi:uncharacterized protein EDB91DRAFT_1255925 [Suillus paluster]|uniref:uncharacterized protein n=1 Tax=Suillus paluster TaxID=48578 RepID=UPI001B86D134|nr:uncharacterized protein EDB91DRAFT_1255925 [Suillus paluster]KAG1722728.1 hypothetical protein EDB91DRAFT_1255925 [Suillus paluster]
MPQPLKYPELAHLPPDEKHKEQQRKWHQAINADPEKKARRRELNRLSKQRSRARKMDTEQQETEGQPSRKRRRTAATTNSAAGPSNIAEPFNAPDITEPSTSSHQPFVSIPIDPALLPQPPNNTEVTTRRACDAATATVHPSTRDIMVTTETPHTCDVSVMTEPAPAPAPPSPALSTLTNLDMDLASDIIGIEVPEQSETIQWSDGRTTVLPCIWEGGVNICHNDAEFVKFLAQLPESCPGSAHVVHAHYRDWSSKPMELCELVNEALRDGKVFLLRGRHKPEPAALDLDYLERYGISSTRPIVAHDVKTRVADFTYPQMTSTVQQFIRDIRDPNKIRFVLDLPFLQGGLPFSLSTIDHGRAAWNLTVTAAQEPVHPDNFFVTGWALLHHAGVLTYFHHDADGAATHVTIDNFNGTKFWCVAFPKYGHKIPRTTLSTIAELFTDLGNNREQIESNWDFETVTLLPGDLLIQPPGQFHAVYTPVATFATGGHFYNHQYMHLTELSRYIDHYKGPTFTNQIHEHSIATFERMIINLPYLPRRVTIYSRSLIALCTMVMESEKYVAAGTGKRKRQKLETAKQAFAMSNAIVTHFWTNLKLSTKKYREGSQMHPGDAIDRDELMSCLAEFTIS